MRYTEATEKRIHEVLRDIQSRIPKNLLANVIVTRKATPTVEMVVKAALASDTFPEQKKKDLQILLDNGHFSKEKVFENPKYAKMIDNFVLREINKAIKAGKIPPMSHVKYLPSIKKIRKENENKETSGGGDDSK